uniref:Uncharacterized protein n=1 Tax=Chrysotila carterae TaxID=13221 RepID=A0A7S4B035_CHRCT|eukprot:6176827-Pleurochrysis_carterae.AAC.2
MGGDDFDEAGTIAGRWLAVPPGYSVDEAVQRKAACKSSAPAPDARGSRASGSTGARGGMEVDAIAACKLGDEANMSRLLDELPLSRLESFAEAVRMARERRASKQPEKHGERNPEPTASQGAAQAYRAPPSKAERAVEDELDSAASIAGRWLNVPPGGTIEQKPRMRAAVAAPTSSPRRQHTSVATRATPSPSTTISGGDMD